jgi:hypothetical protein
MKDGQKSGIDTGHSRECLLGRHGRMLFLVLFSLVCGRLSAEAYIGFGFGGNLGRLGDVSHYNYYWFTSEKEWPATAVDVTLSPAYSIIVGFRITRIGAEFRWFNSSIEAPRQSWSAERVSGTSLIDGEIELHMTAPGVATLIMFWPLAGGKHSDRFQPYLGIGICTYFPKAESTLIYDQYGNLYSTAYDDREDWSPGIIAVLGCNLKLFGGFRLYGELACTGCWVAINKEEDALVSFEFWQWLFSPCVGLNYRIGRH